MYACLFKFTEYLVSHLSDDELVQGSGRTSWYQWVIGWVQDLTEVLKVEKDLLQVR